MEYDRKLFDLCLEHKREVQKREDNKPSYMYEVLTKHNWEYNCLFEWEGELVVFAPMHGTNERIKIFLESDYCLGVFMYGTYYAVRPEHITRANLGTKVLVFSKDYTSYEFLREDYIPYHLF